MSQQLVSGEAVTLHLRPARLGSRIVARGLDLAIEFVAFFLLSWVTGLIALGDGDIAFAVMLVVVVMLMVGYPVVFETAWRGRTPGKAAMGLRVVRDDGGPVRFRHALTRGLLGLVDLWMSSGAVGMITSLLSTRGKRLGDIVAGTFVLQERVPRQHVAQVFMPPQLAAWAATLDLSRLPDDLALAVRGFLGRAAQLRPEARDRMGADLAAAVAACVTPAPPAGTPGWAYLSAVLAERRRRDEARMPGRGAYGPTPGRGAYGAAPGPTPWQPAAPSSGWGTSPDRPPWSASAPSTGSPPPVGPPPPVGSPPADPGPPRLPSAPSPQWGPQPVPSSPPPPAPEPAAGRAAPAAPADGFALPG